VTLQGQSRANNASPAAVPIGGTSWQVYDISGMAVGRGTMARSDATITVCSAGQWVGGGAAVPGYYTVATDIGAVGNVAICPANSRLYVPKASGDQAVAAAAWMGSSPDRDYYSFPQNVNGLSITANLASDPYYSGPQDSARPRRIWIASSAQGNSPNESPTPAQWGEVAAALTAAGHRGAWYECPTNEPENGGWSIDSTISYWQACRKAILAADPEANVMGFCSGGIYNNSGLPAVGQFLAACPAAAFTNHMENSHENLSNIVALRQYFGALKQQFAASRVPNLELWLTETGINGGLYGVLHPRREARQRTVLRFVCESFGWAKEHAYDFPIWDHHGSGLGTFLIDSNNGGTNGNMRAGAYALHVMAEALHGTTCSSTNPPAKLSFGPDNSVGDSLFAGLHYTATDRDVVVLATNGMESSEVTLEVDTGGPVTWWDGMGVAHSAAVQNGRVTVNVNDLLTYVFLPPGSTVSVAPAWFTTRPDLLHGAGVTNEQKIRVSSVNDGSFSENAQHAYGVPRASQPYTSSMVPGQLSATISRAGTGFALMTSGPAWQQAGCSLVSFELKAGGQTVYRYTCPSAVSLEIPSAGNGDTSDLCTLTTWWTSPFAWVVPCSIPPGDVELVIHQASYGGQPDALGSANPTNRYHEGDPQQIQLAEWQIFG
jgi:hypothetical protein